MRMRDRRATAGLHWGVAALCALALVCAPASLPAQGTWTAMLTVQPFPSPYFSDWDQNPNIGSLTIINDSGSEEDIRIFFTITDQANRVIASGTSDPEPIAPGAVAVYDSPYEIAGSGSHDADFERIAARTGRLPEGAYTACASAADASGFVLAEACVEFFIAYPDPPLLIGPENDAVVTDDSPIFQWTPVRVPVDYELTYVVRIVEVLPGQLAGEALAANIPVLEEGDAFGTTLRYPIDARPLETNTTYAWSVRALDQHGYAASANDGQSEIWTFRTEDPGLPSVTTTATTLLMSPGSELGAGGGGDMESLAGICLQWDHPAPPSIRVPLNVSAALIATEIRAPTRFYRDGRTRSWALLAEGGEGHASYLLYGECTPGAVDAPGGLKWIATRAGSFQDLGLDLEPGIRDPGADDDSGELAADELGWRFGLVILSLSSQTVGNLPESFDSANAFLGRVPRQIDVGPGVNVYAELNLGDGAIRTVLEMLGHRDPHLVVQGFVGADRQFSVGGHIGQTEPDTAGTRFEAKTQAELEATILSLRASLPARDPLFLDEWIESTQAEVKLDVKAKGDVGREWYRQDGGWSADLKVEAGIAFSLTVHFDEDTWLGGRQPDGSAVGHTASLRFKKQLYKAGDTTSSVLSADGLAAVIKVESDREFDRVAPLVFNSPAVEVEVDLSRPFKGLDGVKVKLGGQVGTAAATDLGKGSLELAWRTGTPSSSGRGASRGDSIRANIARLEAQQSSALARGDTAEAERLGKQRDLEHYALVSWDLHGREPEPPEAPAGRSLHWKAEVSLGNMSFREMLELIGSADPGPDR